MGRDNSPLALYNPGMKRVVIVGGGSLSPFFLSSLRDADMLIGVDYGAYWLLSHHKTPDFAIGDFDTVTKSQFLQIQKKIKDVSSFSPHKDFTDMELAVEKAVTMHPDEIYIYGAFGTRLDHTIGNVFLLEKYIKNTCTIRLIDKQNEIILVANKARISFDKNRPYVSLLSLTDTATVTLEGFVYPLTNQTIKRGQTIGISNQLKSKNGKIIVQSGKILFIRSKD